MGLGACQVLWPHVLISTPKRKQQPCAEPELDFDGVSVLSGLSPLQNFKTRVHSHLRPEQAGIVPLSLTLLSLTFTAKLEGAKNHGHPNKKKRQSENPTLRATEQLQKSTMCKNAVDLESKTQSFGLKSLTKEGFRGSGLSGSGFSVPGVRAL